MIALIGLCRLGSLRPVPASVYKILNSKTKLCKNILDIYSQSRTTGKYILTKRSIGHTGHWLHSADLDLHKENSFYDRLNIDKNSTHKEIKDAYYKLSKDVHPDQKKVTSSAQSFIDINEAYEVLNDKGKRSEYNEWLYQLNRDDELDDDKPYYDGYHTKNYDYIEPWEFVQRSIGVSVEILKINKYKSLKEIMHQMDSSLSDYGDKTVWLKATMITNGIEMHKVYTFEKTPSVPCEDINYKEITSSCFSDFLIIKGVKTIFPTKVFFEVWHGEEDLGELIIKTKCPTSCLDVSNFLLNVSGIGANSYSIYNIRFSSMASDGVVCYRTYKIQGNLTVTHDGEVFCFGKKLKSVCVGNVVRGLQILDRMPLVNSSDFNSYSCRKWGFIF